MQVYKNCHDYCYFINRRLLYSSPTQKPQPDYAIALLTNLEAIATKKTKNVASQRSNNTEFVLNFAYPLQ
ncbi:MAG: hypothetical protein KME33_17705 [Aetokthonos hydrillicola CCALA 1050]|nr:hypothetical protein [Aetokthonos hydrillicola CCALA 1050]MBW4587006.1 hypothetical protein [Aetokthonos hydrillicola CCALA 1050]